MSLVRWAQTYRAGQRVETIVYFRDGRVWQAGQIVRKTKTGLPVVRVDGMGFDICVDRKGDIRIAGLERHEAQKGGV